MRSIKFLILCLLPAVFISCEKLDKYPLTAANEATFFNGPDDLSKAVAGTYDMLQNFSWQMGHFDAVTNNAYARSNIPQHVLLASNQHSPVNGPQGPVWNAAYRGIQRANFVLKNIDRSPASEAIKTRTIAEMKVLRAFWYHQLVTFFGGVPIITERLTTEEYNTLPRSSRADVLQLIHRDLDEAIAVLPAKYPNAADYGRMTKGAALGIKTRVYLYESDFVNTEATAKAVMDLAAEAGYGLDPDFRTMFLEEGEGGPEAVLDIQFLRGSATGEANVIETQTRAFLQFQGEYNLFDLFEIIGTVDGPSPHSPAELIAMWDAGLDPFKGKDPRLANSIGRAENYNPSVTKLDIRKGSRDGTTTTIATDRDNNGANWMAIRYADILLMFAEARNENTGPDAQVRDAVNAVRHRSSELLPPVPEELNKEELREFIRQERRKEFLFEGLWYNDIRRWGKDYIHKELLKVHFENHAADIASNYDKYLLLPIPQSERDINAALDQNPGYE